jgi:hypothetical protein
MDSFKVHFANAIESAEAKGFDVAYSNEAFELFYLLHFAYHDAALSRSQHGAKLTKCLGEKYEKNDETMYETLLGNQEQAIQHAQPILRRFGLESTVRPSLAFYNTFEEIDTLAAVLWKLKSGRAGGFV